MIIGIINKHFLIYIPHNKNIHLKKMMMKIYNKGKLIINIFGYAIYYKLKGIDSFDSIIKWIFSFKYRSDILNFKGPWITFNATKWLNKKLNNEHMVFEYGSGASTFYLCSKAKHVVSVEHDIEWYKIVNNNLLEKQIKNCTYLFSKPKNRQGSIDYSAESYSSIYLNRIDFKEYVEKISAFPNKYFDFIIVDGRARASCIRSSLPKLKETGYLILDNSERNHYSSTITKYLSQYSKKVFSGLGPFNLLPWETSIWGKDF